MNWAVGNYKPNAITQERLAAYAATAPSHPKPLKNEAGQELYKRWFEKLNKMGLEEKKYMTAFAAPTDKQGIV
jgi:hypothetical protein